jgi:hypothetical protein
MLPTLPIRILSRHTLLDRTCGTFDTHEEP